ncbi:MAG: bifunctional ornithine acetyltransferase/N-acetylglutamate synthase, partial [Paracoccus sp. (in: a-proteobacteria)]|nr:bifunctional ornithine acetyltransferase/N-acetylglutamate synthase [Paracoccus sp. (in: a-proteobacteria)]
MGKAGLSVSPLAPARFPDLPVIDGIRFASAAAGVKYQGRTDVTLIHMARGSTLAGAFTRSSTRAACVLDNQAKLARSGDAPEGAAILVNSGNANAFTGARGQQSVDAICAAVGRALDLPEGRVFTS